MQVSLLLLKNYLTQFDEEKQLISLISDSDVTLPESDAEPEPIQSLRRYISHLDDAKVTELSPGQLFGLINVLFSAIDIEDSFTKERLINRIALSIVSEEIFQELKKLKDAGIFTPDIFNEIHKIIEDSYRLDRVISIVEACIELNNKDLLNKTTQRLVIDFPDQALEIQSMLRLLNRIGYIDDPNNIPGNFRQFISNSNRENLRDVAFQLSEINKAVKNGFDLTLAKKIAKIILDNPDIVNLSNICLNLFKNEITINSEEIERITKLDDEEIDELNTAINVLIHFRDENNSIPNSVRDFIKILLRVPEYSNTLIDLFHKFEVNDRSRFVAIIEDDPVKFTSEAMQSAIDELHEANNLNINTLEPLNLQNLKNPLSVAKGINFLIQGSCFDDKFINMILQYDGEDAEYIGEAIQTLYDEEPDLVDNIYVQNLLLVAPSLAVEITENLTKLMVKDSTLFRDSFENDSNLFQEILAGLAKAAVADKTEDQNFHMRSLTRGLIKLSKNKSLYNEKANRDMLYQKPDYAPIITEALIQVQIAGIPIDDEIRKKINESITYDDYFIDTLSMLHKNEMLNPTNFYVACEGFADQKHEFGLAVEILHNDAFLSQDTFNLIFEKDALKRAEIFHDLVKGGMTLPLSQYPHLKEALELAQLFKEKQTMIDTVTNMQEICRLARAPKPLIQEFSFLDVSEPVLQPGRAVNARLFTPNNSSNETKRSTTHVPIEDIMNAFRKLGERHDLTHRNIEKLFSILRNPESAQSILREVLAESTISPRSKS